MKASGSVTNGQSLPAGLTLLASPFLVTSHPLLSLVGGADGAPHAGEPPLHREQLWERRGPGPQPPLDTTT